MLRHVRTHISKDPWWHVWGLLLGLLFTCMLMLARLFPQYLDAVDSTVQASLTALQTLTYTEPFLVITVLGSTLGISLLTLLGLYLLRRNYFVALQLALLMLFSSISMGIAKTFVERARPDTLMWLDPLNTYSFPSGHATLTTAFFGFVAVTLYRRMRTKSAKYLSVLLCVLTILLVCMSRLILNYHYLTDVIAGMLLGLFWLSVVHMLPRPKKR
jgi:undecaprenyl-diphosphatase